MEGTKRKKSTSTPSTEKKQSPANKYTSTHYDRINLCVPNGYREKLRQASSEAGLSLTEYITIAACEKAGITPPEKRPIIEIDYSGMERKVKK